MLQHFPRTGSPGKENTEKQICNNLFPTAFPATYSCPAVRALLHKRHKNQGWLRGAAKSQHGNFPIPGSVQGLGWWKESLPWTERKERNSWPGEWGSPLAF